MHNIMNNWYPISPTSVSEIITATDLYSKTPHVLHHVVPLHNDLFEHLAYPLLSRNNGNIYQTIVIPTNKYHKTHFVWEEIATGHLIWSNKCNRVEKIHFPFLKQIKETYKTNAPTLKQLALLQLTTRDLQVLKQYIDIA